MAAARATPGALAVSESPSASCGVKRSADEADAHDETSLLAQLDGERTKRRELETTTLALTIALSRAEEKTALAEQKLAQRAHPEGTFPPDGSNWTMRFELYGASPEDSPAWTGYRENNAFFVSWAAQCSAGGVAVVQLNRAERGLCTDGELRQVRMKFPNTTNIFGDPNDIEARQGHMNPRGSKWTLAELRIILNAFVRAMEASLGRGSVRARLYLDCSSSA